MTGIVALFSTRRHRCGAVVWNGERMMEQELIRNHPLMVREVDRYYRFGPALRVERN
ncbi:MAG: hypothetical protein ACREOZ_03620 [Gloeomargaritales cyanobacterium]